MNNHSNQSQYKQGISSIRHRLPVKLAWFSVLLGMVIGIVLSFIQLTLDFQREQQAAENTIQLLMSSVAGVAANAAYLLDESQGRAVISGLFISPVVYRAEIQDNLGGILVEKSIGVQPKKPNFFARALLGEDRIRELALSMPNNSEPVGLMRIWLDPNVLAKDFRSKVWWVLIFGLVGTALLSGALGLLFYIVLARPLVAAVNEIQSKRQEKAKGTIVTIPKKHAHDELGLLLSSFNTLVSEREEAGKYLREVLGNSPIPLLIIRLSDGKLLYANPAAGMMFGVTLEDFMSLSTTLDFYQKPEDIKMLFNQLTRAGEVKNYELPMKRFDGSKLWVNLNGKLSIFEEESVLIAGLLDITERKNSDELIRTLSQAVEQSPVSVVITDADANIEYVNNAFEAVTGYSAVEVVGQNSRILQSGNTAKKTYDEMWQAIGNGKPWRGEIQNRKKDGEIFWEHSHIAPVIDDRGITRHYLAVKEDITFRKQQEEQILHQAHFDTLTGLPNRFLSLDRLSQLINEAQRNKEMSAVLFLDLDDFKKVNDTLGHETGDKLLIEAAKRLRSVVRSGDTVGRLGGDEFIVLLGGLTKVADALPTVEILLNRFRESFRVDGRELIITASVGIAVYPEDGDSASELLRNADSAMYHSKELGRNTYSYFTDEMNLGVTRRLALEEQIHGALDRNEFTVFYQPQIDVISGKIMGTEALLRWSNPALGDVSPIEFIPIAEQTGLIVPIGQFALTEALQKTVEWQNKFDPDFHIAVNLSPRQFRDPDLVNYIEKNILESGLSGGSLALEITEGVLMSGHTFISDALDALSRLGVNIVMDDFGTGYSSLSYLRRYPFDVLKIDQSFVKDITEDRADRELISATIAMAHGLNLKVVAEGVETEEQLAFLKQLGCDYAQGYLFGKPMPGDQLKSSLQVLADNCSRLYSNIDSIALEN